MSIEEMMRAYNFKHNYTCTHCMSIKIYLDTRTTVDRLIKNCLCICLAAVFNL